MTSFKPNEGHIAVVLKLLNVLPLSFCSYIYFNCFLDHMFSEQPSHAQQSDREVTGVFPALRWLTSFTWHVFCLYNINQKEMVFTVKLMALSCT